jgi:hypothetical protein
MSRIVNIILTDLASDVMKHEEAMELAINGKDSVDERIQTIKYHLNKIIETEQMIDKWRSYTAPPYNNDEK